MTKGILKRHSLSGVSVTSSSSDSNDSNHQEDFPKPKRVSFDGAEPARIFEADEWDRSPAEVTLRLTYKDVVELKELDVSLVRTGHFMMERTLSRRPTRQRSPASPSKRSESPPANSPRRAENHPNETTIRPSSPVPSLPLPRLSPTYQSFTSQSLPPLAEDTASVSLPPPVPTEWPESGHSASISDSRSPPGLLIRAPLLKGLPSPTLAPPSPLALSSPSLPFRPQRQKMSSRPLSPVPLLLRPMPPMSHGKPQRIPERPLLLPALSRRASMPDGRTLATGMGALSESALRTDGGSTTLVSLNINGNPSLPTGESSKNAPFSASPTPVVTRRNGRSLMGWELKRAGGGSGKLVFGLVKKGSKEA